MDIQPEKLDRDILSPVDTPVFKKFSKDTWSPPKKIYKEFPRDPGVFYQGIFNTRHENPIRKDVTINFTSDTQVYFDHLEEYSRSFRDRSTIVSRVDRFIESCYFLGTFASEAKRWGIPKYSYDCKTSFYTGRLDIPRDGRGRDNFALSVTLSATIKETVRICVSYEHSLPRDYSDIEIFECPRLPLSLLRATGFKELPRGGYAPAHLRYQPPQFKDLPLYINVPFVRDYARVMFENPPESPFKKPYYGEFTRFI